MSTFAKGLRGPLFLGPFFSFFFWFFLSPAKVGSLEMQPGAKLQAYLGVIILQPHACTQRFRLRILRRTRSNAGRTSAGSLSGRIESIWETPSKERASTGPVFFGWPRILPGIRVWPGRIAFYTVSRLVLFCTIFAWHEMIFAWCCIA